MFNSSYSGHRFDHKWIPRKIYNQISNVVIITIFSSNHLILFNNIKIYPQNRQSITYLKNSNSSSLFIVVIKLFITLFVVRIARMEVRVIAVIFVAFLALKVASESGIQFSDDNKYIVVVLARLGLANRLRALADWHSAAIQTNRKLLFVWIPSVECNVQIHDLFSTLPSTAQALPIVASSATQSYEIIENIAAQFNKTSIRVFPKGFFHDFSVLHSNFDLVMTDYDGILSSVTVPCQAYLSMHSRFLRSLIPLEFIRNQVSSIINNYFMGYLMVGIHIREHDPQYDWAIVPPIDGSNLASNFGEGAHIEDFKFVMSRIWHKFSSSDSQGVFKSKVRFFISSNNHKVKAALLQDYPESIAIQGDLERHTSGGIITALLEWLLLSQCDLLINTYSSTFAVEAGLLSNTPVLGLWHHRLIYSNDPKLAQCGHNQYLAVSRGLFFSLTFLVPKIAFPRMCHISY